MPNIVPSRDEVNLYNALWERGIKVERQYWDGHKHIDLAIPNAKLYIEVDDVGHFIDPERIISDFNRVHYSDHDGFNTFFVTNQILENKDLLVKVTDALVAVIRMRQQNS